MTTLASPSITEARTEAHSEPSAYRSNRLQLSGHAPSFFALTRPLGRLALAALLVATWLAAPVVEAATPAPASAPNGMVVTSQRDATMAGVSILEAGGNAVDAAVATAFALSVTEPYSSGIGGGGFMLIRTAEGDVIALDGRETAPAAATRDMYTRPGVPERASLHGPLAVATPGQVAGLALALELYGTMSLSETLQPAIALAETGFEIGPRAARMIGFMRSRLTSERFPETNRIQFPPDGEASRAGWRLVQKDLAKTLQLIADDGPKAFYEGPIADAIVAEMRRQGGLVTAVDLATYEPVPREPVRGSYRDLEVISFPPPSSGGVVLLEILNILEGYDLGARGQGSSASMHLISEAMKLAFADRAHYLGDSDFVDVPVDRLISTHYADAQRSRINPAWWRRAPWNWFAGETAITVKAAGKAVEDHGTTHFSITDRFGNAVAMTKTINTPYGSGITVPGTGIILNNEMDDFAAAIGVPNAYGLVDMHGANAIAPRKRPLSSMTPTILVKDGAVFMVTGSPGGPRIITSTLLSILNVVDYGMDAVGAVSAPRFHQQWDPDRVLVEPEIPEDVIDGMRSRGHNVERSQRNWSAVEVILVDPKTGTHYGGCEPRRDGLALGY